MVIKDYNIAESRIFKLILCRIQANITTRRLILAKLGRIRQAFILIHPNSASLSLLVPKSSKIGIYNYCNNYFKLIKVFFVLTMTDVVDILVFRFKPCKNICSNFEHKKHTRPSVSVANSRFPPNLN